MNEKAGIALTRVNDRLIIFLLAVTTRIVEFVSEFDITYFVPIFCAASDLAAFMLSYDNLFYHLITKIKFTSST